MRPEPGYNDRELERGRRIRDEIRKGDYLPGLPLQGRPARARLPEQPCS